MKCGGVPGQRLIRPRDCLVWETLYPPGVGGVGKKKGFVYLKLDFNFRPL